MGEFYVYMWRNRVNGKCYVGKGKGRRARDHLGMAKGAKSNGAALLHRAIRKYGAESFELSFLALGLEEPMAFALEQAAISAYSTMADNGYNLTAGGEGAAGAVVSNRTREKMSEAKKGRKFSDAHRARIAAALKGRKISEASRAKMTRAQRGRRLSASHRAKISAAGWALTPAQRTNVAILTELGAVASDLAIWFGVSDRAIFNTRKETGSLPGRTGRPAYRII